MKARPDNLPAGRASARALARLVGDARLARTLAPPLRRGSGRLCATAAALLLLAAPAYAQNLTLSQPTIAGGGAVVTNGTLRATVTLGQPLAAPRVSAGTLTLESGFWTRAVAVQTEGAPPLRLSRVGNSLSLAWTAAPAGFRLQVADRLGPTANWRAVAETATPSGGDSTVTTPVLPGPRFYRLLRPPGLP